ncbi:MAG: hypothetical protein RR061_04740 [Muribaculaceae bacterium]
MKNIFKSIAYITVIAMCMACNKNSGGGEPTPPIPPPNPDPIVVPVPDPTSRVLYNGVTLPSTWPPYNSSSNIYNGMSPSYLTSKPANIDIAMGRQLFVDNFLIAESTLKRVWHQADYYSSNPVLSPEREWEMSGTKGGGFAAPFSDGVWFDEVDGKFKMWYMAGGNTYGDGNPVTCYAESNDGINWVRPSLNIVSGTNIIQKGKNRDSNTIWIDKTAKNESQRYKMFNVYGGAGNWKYHYFTSQDGKAWREQKESKAIADRSTVFHNPFRGVWAFSMRHNVRVDASNLVRGRDYSENPDAEQGTANAVADLQKFWFGPWSSSEPVHPSYTGVKPAIYNLDAIGYESVMLGMFSVWSGPENDVCAKDNVIKRNQILLGFSRDGWSWYREDFTPFCAVGNNKTDWNNGNIQSVVGSPIIVGDKLYFYMSGRKLNDKNAEITTTGMATLRRDGFASMSGSGTLLTEKIKFKGEHFYVNANVKGTLKVEILNVNGTVITGFSKDDCVAFNGDSTKTKITWKNNKNLASLKNQSIKIKFYVEDGDLYSFWISQFENGKSFGYTAGGGAGLSKYGIDL